MLAAGQVPSCLLLCGNEGGQKEDAVGSSQELQGLSVLSWNLSPGHLQVGRESEVPVLCPLASPFCSAASVATSTQHREAWLLSLTPFSPPGDY